MLDERLLHIVVRMPRVALQTRVQLVADAFEMLSERVFVALRLVQLLERIVYAIRAEIALHLEMFRLALLVDRRLLRGVVLFHQRIARKHGLFGGTRVDRLIRHCVAQRKQLRVAERILQLA